MKHRGLKVLSRSTSSRFSNLSKGLKVLSLSKGFTVVELIVVISIMGILLALGTISLTGSMANGRDAERKGDVEAIAMHLENYYRSHEGKYPAIHDFISLNSYPNVSKLLPDINPKSLDAPGVSDSFSAAANVNVPSAITKNQYIYQPFTSAGGLCSTALTECRNFKLYYKIEVSKLECPVDICTVESKNQ